MTLKKLLKKYIERLADQPEQIKCGDRNSQKDSGDTKPERTEHSEQEEVNGACEPNEENKV